MGISYKIMAKSRKCTQLRSYHKVRSIYRGVSGIEGTNREGEMPMD
jgi:hypothetical protein